MNVREQNVSSFHAVMVSIQDPVKVFFNSNIAKENTRDLSSLKYQNFVKRAQAVSCWFLYMNKVSK